MTGVSFEFCLFVLVWSHQQSRCCKGHAVCINTLFALRCLLMRSQQETMLSLLLTWTLSKHWLPPAKPLSLGNSRRRHLQSDASAALPAAHLFSLWVVSHSVCQREDPLTPDGFILADGWWQWEDLHHLVGLKLSCSPPAWKRKTLVSTRAPVVTTRYLKDSNQQSDAEVVSLSLTWSTELFVLLL